MTDELADELRYGSVKAIEPNRAGLMLAKALRATKDFGNKVELGYPPLTGTMGIGDLLMGQGPELAEDLSYGFSGSRGKGMTYKPDPRYLDLALTPVPYGIIGKGAKSLAAKMLVGEEGVMANEARRNFLKQGSALAGSSAIGGVAGVDLVKALIPAATVQVGKAGIGSLGSALMSNALKWAEKHAQTLGDNVGWIEYSKSGMLDQLANHAKNPEYGKALDKALSGGHGGSVDENLIAKLTSTASHNDFYRASGQEARVTKTHALSEDPTLYEEYSKKLKELEEKLRGGDKKLLVDLEELTLTGKLPKGADPLLGELEPHQYLSRESKLDDLLEQIGKEYDKYLERVGD